MSVNVLHSKEYTAALIFEVPIQVKFNITLLLPNQNINLRASLDLHNRSEVSEFHYTQVISVK